MAKYLVVTEYAQETGLTPVVETVEGTSLEATKLGQAIVMAAELPADSLPRIVRVTAYGWRQGRYRAMWSAPVDRKAR